MTDHPNVPLRPVRPHELELLLDLEDQRRTYGMPRDTSAAARGMLDVLRDLTENFQRQHVRYALCGTLALAFFARARATEVLAFVCLASQREDIIFIVRHASFTLRQVSPGRLTFVDSLSGIQLVILLGTIEPEISAVADALGGDCLGVATRLVRPEHLLWIYCHGGQEQDRADAIALLQGGQVDVPRLRRYFLAANDTKANEQLSVLQLCVQREADQGDYSASVARRLAARERTRQTKL